jgi:glycosyltransferase involved in cell wall biosynthesis
MKIIHMVCSQLPIGGFEVSIHNYCNYLTERGHEVILLCRKMTPRLAPSICDIEETKYDVKRYFLPRSKGYFHSFFGKRAIRDLATSFEPDIIHCTMGWPCPVWCLDAFKDSFPGLVAYFQGGDIRAQDRRIKKGIRRVLADCPNLLTVSESMREDMIKMGVPTERISILPVGVNCSLFQGEKEPSPFAGDYIFSMGRLIPKKGFDLVLNAFAHFLKKSEKPLHLCIAGDGSEKGNLLKEAVDLGINDRVHFVGFVTGEEKKAWFQNALFYVHPARQEPVGIVNAEAMASGLPVVAFEVDGLPEIIENKKNGFLIQPFDTEKFADRILTLQNDLDLRKAMGISAQQMVRRLDWVELTDKLERYYGSIII